ncbi:hypothetical protein RhiLY_05882 [Ceratobasidium sp. AG-Ba]|nr:hypothetical protein RhiLY_05882 [Ceratobasidium sp. AG-Ba]
MVSRLQLNLRSNTIHSPTTFSSQSLPIPSLQTNADESKTHEQQFDSHGTSSVVSSFSHYFQSTVAELGKDIETIREETYMGGTNLQWRGNKCPVHAGSDIEMGPIRPVIGGVLVHSASQFSPAEQEWLDSTILVSPVIVDEKWSGDLL